MDFYSRVYEIVGQIPYGRVISYGQIAALLGMPRGARQVGWAMRSCPENLPWHRVVMADGTITGGEYAEMRRDLLVAENVPFLQDGRVDMAAACAINAQPRKAQANDWALSRAKSEEAEGIFDIIRGLVGKEGCTWNDDYPTLQDIEEDIALGATFVLRDHNGEIIGTSFLAKIDEAVYQSLFSKCSLKNPCDIARLGIRNCLLGRGFGKKLLAKLIDRAIDEGHDGIRLLVSPQNAPALALYKGFGFEEIDSAVYYDHEWLCYQLVF